jgi:cobalamin-dependent methionine synthase I
VIDLGVMVSAKKIDTAVEHNADIIGLSGSSRLRSRKWRTSRGNATAL